jgi:hypothetical protein
MHFQVWIGAEPVELKQGTANTELFETLARLGATVPAGLPARDNKGLERFWPYPSPQGLTQIRALGSIEAQEPQTIGGEPTTVAGAAKWCGGRGNNAKACAIRQAKTLRWG